MTKRFLRSIKRRYWLWKAQDGKCAECGEDLPDDWHADHIKPWKETQRTNVFEIQALCPKCNLKKGSRMIEKQNNQEIMAFDWKACRRGTKEVINIAIERFTSGEKFQSNNLPTRYGKTPTGRLLGGIGTRGWITPQGNRVDPFSCTNLWMTHNTTLRRQFASDKKWNEFKEIFKLRTRLIYSEIEAIPRNYIRGIRPNNEDFLACTIQLVLSNQNLFCDWIDHELYKTGLPPMIHFDECHLANLNKPWGDILTKLEEAGACIVVWTATAKRADNGLIPFFLSDRIGTKEYKKLIPVDEFEIDGVEFIQADQYGVRRTDYSLKAHVNVPFSEAWAEGYLCKISHQTFDVDLTKIEGEDISEGHQLKDLSGSYVRKSGVLGRILRDPLLIQPACEQALKYLIQHRRFNPHAAMIIFSEADTASIANRHAKAIAREFEKLNRNLIIDIATSKSDDAPNVVLEDFVENDHDIIIVKDMAGAGWDCPRVKIVFDLSSTRQDASTIQRWTRGATPDDMSEVMTLLTPNDALANDISQRWIKEEGGEASVTIEEFIGTEFFRKKEKEKSIFVAQEVFEGDFSDNEGLIASPDRNEVVELMLGAFPTALKDQTRASISHKLESIGVTFMRPKDSSPEASIDKKIHNLQQSVIDVMDDIQRLYYRQQFSEYNKRLWRMTLVECYKNLYERSGIPYENREVRKNRDIDQLSRMRLEAEKWREELLCH